MNWRNAHTDPPEAGQEVYYFGPNIGLHIGKFDPTVETKGLIENEAGESVLVDLPKSVINAINHNKFINNDWGVCDADDAPWWLPYDPQRAKSWVPLPPVIALSIDEWLAIEWAEEEARKMGYSKKAAWLRMTLTRRAAPTTSFSG